MQHYGQLSNLSMPSCHHIRTYVPTWGGVGLRNINTYDYGLDSYYEVPYTTPSTAAKHRSGTSIILLLLLLDAIIITPGTSSSNLFVVRTRKQTKYNFVHKCKNRFGMNITEQMILTFPDTLVQY